MKIPLGLNGRAGFSLSGVDKTRQICYTTPWNSPQGAEPVEVTDFGHSGGLLSLCNPQGSGAFSFPDACMRGGDDMEYMTWQDFVYVSLQILAIVIAILSYLHRNDHHSDQDKKR